MLRYLVILALAGCSGPATPAPACTQAELLVAASDYSSSAVGGAPKTGAANLASGLDLGRDPQLSLSTGRAFYLARDADLVFELDPHCGTPIGRTSVHAAAASGAANPHDVAAAPDGSLFAVLYNVPRVAVMKDGGIDTIDIASFDPDGNPQAESIRIVDVDGTSKAFVALERLDDNDHLASKLPSLMLRIDVLTHKVETSVELAGRNPFNPMSEDQGALLLAEPGSFDVADEAFAGIERFDTRTMTTRLLVHEADLGGSVAEVAVDAGCGAALIAGPVANVNPTALVTFDASSGRVLSTYATPAFGPTPGYDLEGLAWKDGSLYVGDRRRGGAGYRVHVFDRAAGCILRESTRVIDLSQRPVALRPATTR